MGKWRLLGVPLLIAPGMALAGEQPVPVDAGAPASDTPHAVWIAGISAGLVERDGGSDNPYASLSMTRHGRTNYLRGAFTAYRGTLQQLDAALPSTYYIGSLGAGGNWNDWIVDAYLSYGRQRFGKVETPAGKRRSEAGSGTPYYAAGLRAGHIFRPAPRWYATPALGIQFSDTRSLRHRIDAGRAQDFTLHEQSITGLASFRVDHTMGSEEQHFVGVAFARYESNNGLTSWNASGPTGSSIDLDAMADGWQEIGLSATWRLSRKLWIDNQIQRTFNTEAGDSTMFSIGLRLAR